jgi:hypothetical protein
MAGILDSKSRFLDTILTIQGRTQLAQGGLSIQWVSFSDIGTFYSADVVSGSADSSARLSFEACINRNDQLTFLANDHGQLLAFPTLNEAGTTYGKTTSGSIVVTDKTKFASLSQKLLNSSLDNFKKLYTIGSIDQTFDDTDFILSSNRVLFSMDNQNPTNRTTADINTLEKFNEDIKLSNLHNFMYLPPINKLSENQEITDEIIKSNMLGPYKKESWSKKIVYSDVSKEINELDNKGQVKTIRFEVTSRDSHLLCQFFEQNQDELLKLDIIDCGEFATTDDNFPKKHVYYAGKIILDDNDSPTFINLFTLIFE